MSSDISRRPVTVEDLTYVLFGNPINPQDKGLIGRMQDQMKTIIRLAIAILLALIGAILTFSVDVLTRYH